MQLNIFSNIYRTNNYTYIGGLNIYMRRQNSVLELIRAFNEYTLTDEFKFEFITYSELIEGQFDVVGYCLANRKGTSDLAIVLLLEEHSDDELLSLKKTLHPNLASRRFKNFIYVPNNQKPGSFVLEETNDELFSDTSNFHTFASAFIPVYNINVLHDNDIDIEWKDYDSDYEISNIGAIRNKSTKKLLMPVVSKTGGFIYNIKRKPATAAKMVAEAFIGPAPSKDMVVVHINGDRYDNRVCNLKWGNLSEKYSKVTIARMSRARRFLYTYGPDAKHNRSKLSKSAKRRCAGGHSNSLKWKKYYVEVKYDDGRIRKFYTVKSYARISGFNPSRVYPYIKTGKHFDAGHCYIRRVEIKNKGE